MCQQINQRENPKIHGNIMFQNQWDVGTAVLRAKFTEIQAYLKKQEKSQ